ncbi:integumentary mucin C.1-like isoform X2 [Ochlerotatus camptorhynchus]|uniref:integumentary mucin C.1-like isoform X2 n=1 Tax=Ochlerotatus camptorhynchus TaxID=644619 RepID=UPI0031DD6365
MSSEAEALLVPIVAIMLVFAYLAGYFYVRYRTLTQYAAAAAQNPAIIYTIPTNAPGLATRPNTGSSILYPNRTTTYFPPSTDLPPSYEDVTKDSPVIVNLSTTEVTPSSTTTTPIGTTTTTTTTVASS